MIASRTITGLRCLRAGNALIAIVELTIKPPVRFLEVTVVEKGTPVREGEWNCHP
jgi:hypothetical protein